MSKTMQQLFFERLEARLPEGFSLSVDYHYANTGTLAAPEITLMWIIPAVLLAHLLLPLRSTVILLYANLIAILLVVANLAWVQIFRYSERTPRARQQAQQIASVINLTRAALITARPDKRLGLLRELSREEGIDAVMDEHKLDAIVVPSGGPAHRTDLVWGDRGTGGISSPAAVSGYPSITVPAGMISGLPLGISFFGRAWSEPTLLKIAYAFEQQTKARRSPNFLATTDEA